MKRRMLLVTGYADEPPLCRGLRWMSVPWSRLSMEIARCESGVVLLLGPLALEGRRPGDLPLVARAPQCFLIADSGNLASRALRPWVREATVRLPDKAHLGGVIVDLLRVPVLPSIPPEGWLPRLPRPGSLASRIAAVVPFLRPPRLGTLARALRVPRQYLREESLEAFGLNPSRLLWRYVRSVVLAARFLGMTLTAVADGLGVDPGTIRRHFEHRGGPPPPLGLGPSGPAGNGG